MATDTGLHLSPEARLLIGGLIAPDEVLEGLGIDSRANLFAPQEVWDEVVGAFPAWPLHDYVDEDGSAYVDHRVKEVVPDE